MLMGLLVDGLLACLLSDCLRNLCATDSSFCALKLAHARDTPKNLCGVSTRQPLLQDNACQALFCWGWRLVDPKKQDNDTVVRITWGCV